MQTGRTAEQEAAEDVFFGQVVIIWARWFVIGAVAIMTLWNATTVEDITINTLLIGGLMAVNFFLHGRYMMEKPVNRTVLIAVSVLDIAVVSAIVFAGTAPGSEHFVFYYPFLVAVAFVLPPRISIPYTVLALAAYATVAFVTYAAYEIPFAVGDLKLLVVRMITLAAVGGLGMYYWRLQRGRRTAMRAAA